jgi:stress response protein SCP2
MATVTGPAKGKAAPLPLEGAGRILAGLSWTPKADGAPSGKIPVPQLRDAEGRYDSFYFFRLPVYYARLLFRALAGAGRRGGDPHDLDLFCYVFDRDMQLLHVVGPKNAELIDPSRKIYHSGENQTGREKADAEQVFVETRGLPPEYHSLTFVVKSANSYSLADIPDAGVRLADSASNTDHLLNTVAAKAMPPGNAYGYVFCSVARDGAGWTVRNIDSFAGRAVDWNLLLPALEMA